MNHTNLITTHNKTISTILILVLLFSFLNFSFFPRTRADIKSIDADSDDGYIFYYGSSYSEVHDSRVGETNVPINNIYVGQQVTTHFAQDIKADSTYTICRGFLFFDTSELQEDLEIISVDLKIKTIRDYSDVDFDIILKSGGSIYPHKPLISEDYDITNYESETGGSWNTSEYPGEDEYITISLNSEGMSWINYDGYTKFALLSKRDVDRIPPEAQYPNERSNEYMLFYSADSSGDEPYLEITYNSNSAPNSPAHPSPEDESIIAEATEVRLEVDVEDPDDQSMDVSFLEPVFHDDFDDGDISDWTIHYEDGDPDTGLTKSNCDEGYGLRVDGDDWAESSSFDCSHLSRVQATAYMNVWSMDSSVEKGNFDWYDGSSWHTLESFQNEEGSFTIYVSDLLLSSNNKIRFDLVVSNGHQDCGVIDSIKIGTRFGFERDVPSGSTASCLWEGLSPGENYNWYAIASDSIDTTPSPVWSFTINNNPDTPFNPIPSNGESIQDSTSVNISVEVNDQDNDLLDVTFYNHDNNNVIGTIDDIVSGNRANVTWSGLSIGNTYNWYASVNDGTSSIASSPWSFTIDGNSNSDPVANDDYITIGEDSINVQIDVLDNDTDPDINDVLSIESVSPSTHGTTSINSDFIYYTPDENYYGSDSFTYTITDNNGSSGISATVYVTITSINDPPDVNDDSADTDEEQFVWIHVLDNDNDVDSSIDVGSIDIVTYPTKGSVSINSSTGEIQYIPDIDETGLDTFEYTVDDIEGDTSNVGIVSITINDINEPPVAEDDFLTTDKNNAKWIHILTNDSDSDGSIDIRSVVIVDNPSNGNIVLNSTSGEVLYRPDTDFVGSDIFNYTVKDDDGETSNSASVFITVNDYNIAPIANDDFVNLFEDGSIWMQILNNDIDSDGSIDVSTISIIDTASNGNININYTTGEVQYTPNLDFVGSDIFNYTVKDDDGETSNLASVFITISNVNDDPLISTVDVVSGVEDVLYSVDYDADDVDGDSLIWSLVGNASFLVIDSVSGVLSGVPGDSDVGVFWVNVSVVDGNGGLDWSNFTLVILDINNKPDKPINPSPSDQEINVSLSPILSVYVNDADNDLLIIRFYEDVDWDINRDGIVNQTDSDLISDHWLEEGEPGWIREDINQDGIVNSLDIILISLHWNENSLIGNDTIIGNGTANITWDDADQYSTIYYWYAVAVDNEESNKSDPWIFTTLSQNNPPVIDAIDDQIIDEGDSFSSISLDDFVSDAEDSDENISWSYSGNVELVVSIVDRVASIVIPDVDWFGEEIVNFTATDTGGRNDSVDVLFRVNSVNDYPFILTPNVLVAIEDETYSVDYDADDVDGDLLTWNLNSNASFLSIDSFVGLLSGTPGDSDVGVFWVNVSVVDGNGGLDWSNFTLTVYGDNEYPVANDDYVFVSEGNSVNQLINGDDSVLDNDTDADFDTLTASLISSPLYDSGFIFNSDGTFIYTHDGSETSFDSFVYNVSDGKGGWDHATVYITIIGNNDEPIITTVDVETATEDVLYSVDYDANDPEFDSISWSLNTNASFLSINSGNGILSGTPGNSDIGSYWVNVTADDGNGGLDFSNFTLSVLNVNDQPEITTIDVSTATKEILYSVDYDAVDVDVGDVLVWSLVSNASFLGIDSVSGVLSGVPGDSDVGVFWVNVSVLDGNGGLDWSNFTLTVYNTNSPPVANDDNNITDEDQSLIIDVLHNDNDIDGSINPASILIINNPLHGSLNINYSTGLITYIPNSNYYGNDVFNYTIEDDVGAVSNIASVQIIINSINDPIQISNENPVDGSTNQDLNVNFTVELIDIEGDIINWTINCINNGINNYKYIDDNGTKYLQLNNLEYDTEYTITVKAYDGINWTNNSYKFTTKSRRNNPSDDLPRDNYYPENVIVDEIVENNPPEIPEAPVLPAYPAVLESGVLYTFIVSSYDVDNEKIRFMFNWGDGTNSNWSDYVLSNETVEMTHTWQKVGSYNIKVRSGDENGSNSEWSEPINIIITIRPIAEFNITGNKTINQPILFNATQSYDLDGEIIKYLWDFDDGSNSTDRIINHTYKKPGTYNVSLTVSDNYNLSNVIVKTIKIQSEKNEFKNNSTAGNNINKLNLFEILPIIGLIFAVIASFLLLAVLFKKRDKIELFKRSISVKPEPKPLAYPIIEKVTVGLSMGDSPTFETFTRYKKPKKDKQENKPEIKTQNIIQNDDSKIIKPDFFKIAREDGRDKKSKIIIDEIIINENQTVKEKQVSTRKSKGTNKINKKKSKKKIKNNTKKINSNKKKSSKNTSSNKKNRKKTKKVNTKKKQTSKKSPSKKITSKKNKSKTNKTKTKKSKK